jgi:vacuolar-type H+-ATPase subunit I/STV1
MEVEKINEMLKEINEAFFEIPFGNSGFQTKNFVINGQLTPERAYRSIGLELTNKIKALKEAYYGLKKEDIDLEELRENLEAEGNKFERRRIELDIEQKLDAREQHKKLINDALHTVNQLYDAFKRFPRYTREEFEAGELEHFKIKLLQQTRNITGAAKSLADMGFDLEKTGSTLKELTGYDVLNVNKKLE